VPRIVADIFEAFDTAGSEFEFTMKVSYVEIYQEKIRDLLAPASDNLRLREDKALGIVIEGANEQYVTNKVGAACVCACALRVACVLGWWAS
jgi:kinesin family protein 5